MSSTVGSATKTGWKRRASAASFSTCFLYSSSVVAPMQCSSPRASAGLSRLEASIAPSALPAPTSVCISSMNRMMPPAEDDHLLQHGLQPLLELAAVFRAGDQRAHVEREQLLVVEAFRHVAVDDAQRQPFDDGGLADAGLADQHRIVLGAAGEHLDGAADFLVAADHRIELAVARRLGEVAGVFLQRVIGVLGRTRIGGAALAQRLDRGVEILRRDAGPFEDLARLVVLLDRQRQQQPLDGDEGIAGLLRQLFRGVEHARERRIDIELARPAAFHLGTLLQRRLDLGERLARAAAGAVDQAGGEPFRIVEQHLEEVLGGELLMPLAQRKRLRRLDESAGPVGVFVEIHGSSLLPAAREGAAGVSSWAPQ